MIEALKRHRWAALLCILAPTTIAAQTTPEQKRQLKAALEGKNVVLKLEMPASKDGVDVHPKRAPQVDFSKHQKRIQRFGVALKMGDAARITKIDIEKKHIEIHLNGGGCCPYGWPPAFQGSPKSARELELEAAVREAKNRTQYERAFRDLTSEQTRRKQRDAQTKSEYDTRIRHERRRYGTRFNLRYSERLTPEQITEDSVIQAMDEFIDVPYLAQRRLQELMVQAQGLMDRGAYLQAAVAWREVRAALPDDPAVQAAWDTCLERLNQQATEALEGGLDAQSDPERAERIWNSVLQLEPENPPAVAGLKRVQSMARLTELLEQAELHFAAGEFEQAKAAWAEALRMDSGSQRALDGIARLPAEGPSTAEGDRYAVIIGVSQFQDAKIPALRYTDDDARGVYEVLTDPDLGGFDKDNVQLLIDEDATSQKIKAAVGTWLRREAGENDTVVIFFAGHGAPEPDLDDAVQKTYWLTHDARIDDLYSSALSNDEIADMLSRVRAQRIVAFIDSCYSAATVNRTAGARGSVIVEDPFAKFKGEGRVTITSSDGRQESLELTEFGHGVFTHYLLEALRGRADSDGDGVIRLGEIWEHVNRHVPETARRFGGLQTPVIDGAYSAGIELGRIQSTVSAKALDRLYNDQLLNVSHYVEGIRLLRTPPEELSECQARIRELIERMLRGELSPEAYAIARDPLICG